MSKKKVKSSIVLEHSLQTFFFDRLTEVNRKTLNPLPQEVIYYASLLMDHYSNAGELFEKNDGKIRDKILGLKLLESGQLEEGPRKKILKDIGDTSLFVTGFFAESLERKMIDERYMQQIGRSAFERLNKIVPSQYDVISFFKMIANLFQRIVLIISQVGRELSKENTYVGVYLFEQKIKTA